jgi:predicted Mrr-cat superfamily restriction endonuclease
MPTIKQLKAILKVNKSKNCKPYSTLNKAGLIRLANELGILTQNPEKKQREVKTREVKTRVKKEKKQREVKTKVKKEKKQREVKKEKKQRELKTKKNLMHDVKYISKNFYEG